MAALNVAQEVERRDIDGICCEKRGLDSDSSVANVFDALAALDALREEYKTVCVYCSDGLSRGPFVVLLYLQSISFSQRRASMTVDWRTVPSCFATGNERRLYAHMRMLAPEMDIAPYLIDLYRCIDKKQLCTRLCAAHR